MLGMLTVLVTLFAAYSAAHYLENAAYGLMPVTTVINLILFKVIIYLDILLPSTFYLSIIVGLGRLYKDGEITALFASGVGLGRVMVIVFALSLVVAFLVGGLSIYLRPWAYKQSYELKAKAKSEFDVSRLEAGKFYQIGKEGRVIYISKINHRQKSAGGIFMEQDEKDENDTLEVMYAKEAHQYLDRVTGRQSILFLDGCLYEFPHKGKEGGNVMRFGQLKRDLWPKEIPPIEYKIKAAPTIHLIRSLAPSDIAELQWRLSVPLSTILLAMLGVPLSRTTPREGKYAKIAIGMFICGLYYGIWKMAKILVIQGFVPPLPGIWWVQVLLAGLLVILLYHSFRH